MCLAVPSRIEKIEDNIALVDVDGVKREVNLLLIEDARVGEYIIVHAGFAIHKIDESAAKESLNLLREGLALADEGA